MWRLEQVVPRSRGRQGQAEDLGRVGRGLCSLWGASGVDMGLMRSAPHAVAESTHTKLGYGVTTKAKKWEQPDAHPWAEKENMVCLSTDRAPVWMNLRTGCAERSHTAGHVHCASSRVYCPEKANPQRQKVGEWFPGTGGEEGALADGAGFLIVG